MWQTVAVASALVGDEIHVLLARLVTEKDAEGTLLVLLTDAELEVQQAEKPEESHVQNLKVAVVLEDALLPELQWTSLIQNEAVGEEHQQGTDVRSLVVAHVLVDLVHGLSEINARVREREDNVGVAVLARVHQADTLKNRLAGGLALGPGRDTLQCIHKPQHKNEVIRVLSEPRHIGAEHHHILNLALVSLPILCVRGD
mmetsp:Transcript_72061/g.188844  ORF Transcript_72061/g.188844 Transcript_72061/m.188844 type:complete len:200 (+) Transcript_72061:159-758(+)